MDEEESGLISNQIDLLSKSLEEPKGFAPRNFTKNVVDLLMSLGTFLEKDYLDLENLGDLSKAFKEIEEDLYHIFESQLDMNRTEVQRCVFNCGFHT